MSDEEDTMKTEIRASLVVAGYSCNHEEVSAAFGVQPTRTWNAGDRTTLGTLRRKKKGWRFESDLPTSSTMEEHAVRLLDLIKPDFSKLNSIGPYEAAMSFAVETYGGDRPSLGLEYKMMEKLSEMKADLDIDLYVFD